MKHLGMGLAALLLASVGMHAQNYTNPFSHLLLDEKTYDMIVGESSGDRAYNYMLDIAPYERNRSHSEYTGHFFESDYVMDKLAEFGIKTATLDVVGETSTWDGISGSLWEVSPKLTKIADYDDLAATLAQGSANADVTAELVWVGSGSADELAKLDLDGKIVLTESSGGTVLMRAQQAGAIGAVSFASSRPLRDPLQIPNSGIRGNGQGFCFNISPRDGHVLRDRLRSGEKITVHAKVEATTENTDNEVPTCVIKGSDPDAGEIVLVAHLFEGYVKLGANDNISGAVVLMEVARTLQKLIDNGDIPQPKRDIRILWVNEISATTAWIAQNRKEMAKSLCGINLDMVGLWLSKDGAFFCGHRTLMGNPHYINDVQESFFHYMGATNKGFVSTGVGRPEALKPVYSATGSHDPFYYAINAHYGSSDHECFNDWGVRVPMTILNTWPDSYYHTSGDRPDICDPTQLHRATVITASIAYTIACADEKGAIAIASEVAANAGKRMSVRMADDLSNLSKADAQSFAALHKLARFDQDAILINEKATLNSVLELAPNSAALKNYVASLSASLQSKSAACAKEIDASAAAMAVVLGVAAPDTKKGIALTDLEKKASKIFPRATAKVMEIGGGVIRTVPRDVRLAHADDVAKLASDGVNSVLDIKKMQDVQFPDADSLENILKYLDLLKSEGLVTF
ncbi:MAG: M28 family peptidase [Bacteroidales bacterium]|nr:M28 family peptidase [Bacteroidales bacterium]